MTHQPQANEREANFQPESWRDEVPAGTWNDLLDLLCDHGFAGMAQAMQVLFNEAMKLERADALGARPYERTPLRRGQANGFKSKTIETRLGPLELRVPQTRGVPFYPSSLEKGQRSERALKLAIAEMYVQGVTTRKVTSSQVSRAVQALDAELTAWRERPLGGIPYVFLDARYEKVRVNGVVVSCSLLVAIGITPEGRRTVLGLSVSLSEAEVHWRDFLASLQARGLHGVQLVVSDDHAGLKAALATRMAGVKWQRCQFHLAHNLLDYLPPNVSQEEASAELRGVFNAPNRAEAERLLALMVKKYAPISKRLAAWLETSISEGLTVFDCPVEHRRRLRTNNSLERLNREIKRRTRVATLFPNEASLLRLATAVLMETDEEWQSDKRYLSQVTPSTAY
jgi:putative transposase